MEKSEPRITVTESPTQTTIRMEGDLDASTIAGFRDAAFTAIGPRPDLLLLDLSAVPYVDTAALATLVTVARVALRVQVAVRVRPAPHLRRVLQITGLTRLLPIVEPNGGSANGGDAAPDADTGDAA